MPTATITANTATVSYNNGTPAISPSPINLYKQDTVTITLAADWPGSNRSINQVCFYHDAAKTLPAGGWTSAPVFSVAAKGSGVTVTDIEVTSVQMDWYYTLLMQWKDGKGTVHRLALDPELINKAGNGNGTTLSATVAYNGGSPSISTGTVSLFNGQAVDIVLGSDFPAGAQIVAVNFFWDAAKTMPWGGWSRSPAFSVSGLPSGHLEITDIEDLASGEDDFWYQLLVHYHDANGNPQQVPVDPELINKAGTGSTGAVVPRRMVEVAAAEPGSLRAAGYAAAVGEANYDVIVVYNNGNPALPSASITLYQNDTVTVELGPGFPLASAIEKVSFYHDQQKTNSAGSWTSAHGATPDLTAFSVAPNGGIAGHSVVITDIEHLTKGEKDYWYGLEISDGTQTWIVDPELINKSGTPPT